jgi:hypothetical protein
MDVKVKIACWGKEVIVRAEDLLGKIPEKADPKKVFNVVAAKIDQMMDEYKIADPDCGIKPAKATHTIVTEPNGQYRLQPIKKA